MTKTTILSTNPTTKYLINPAGPAMIVRDKWLLELALQLFFICAYAVAVYAD